MKITESQLRVIVKRIIKESPYGAPKSLAPGMMVPGSDSDTCDGCGEPVDPSEISPAGLCPDCEWSNATGEEEMEPCADCGEMFPVDELGAGYCKDCMEKEY